MIKIPNKNTIIFIYIYINKKNLYIYTRDISGKRSILLREIKGLNDNPSIKINGSDIPCH